MELTATLEGSRCPPHEMTPTKLGEPFSELFHQSRFVVDSACEPHMKNAPAIFILTPATKVSLLLLAFHRAAGKKLWQNAVGRFRRPRRRIGRRSTG